MVLTCTHNLCFGAKIRKISNFFPVEFFIFTPKNFCISHGRLFVIVTGTSSSKVGVVIVVIVIVIVVLVVGGWIFYAYKNPTSKSGIWLMEVCGTMTTEVVMDGTICQNLYAKTYRPISGAALIRNWPISFGI